MCIFWWIFISLFLTPSRVLKKNWSSNIRIPIFWLLLLFLFSLHFFFFFFGIILFVFRRRSHFRPKLFAFVSFFSIFFFGMGNGNIYTSAPHFHYHLLLKYYPRLLCVLFLIWSKMSKSYRKLSKQTIKADYKAP